jgi:predicted flavoprotein YhiN
LGEFESRTLPSKTMPGLFIVGELLELGGPIGGCNFHAAFNTGLLG